MVADFGFAKPISALDPMTCSTVGTPLWMAPEVLQGFTAPGKAAAMDAARRGVKLEGYDGFKADVWSVGAMTFGMLAGT